MHSAGAGWLRCGDLLVHIERREVVRSGQRVELSWRAFEALSAMLGAKGAVVERGDLLARLWPGVHVEDSSLNQCMAQLRRSVGEGVIETVPRIGYRIVLPVEPGADQLAIEPPAAEAPIQAPGPQPKRGRRWISAVGIALAVVTTGVAGKIYLEKDGRRKEVRQLETEAARLARSGRFTDIAEAMERLQRAVAIDPSSAHTHALMAETMLRSGQGVAGQERTEAERAVALDPECEECQAILGWVLMSREWRWRDAEEHLSLALKRNPADAYAHQWYAQLLASRGNLDRALDESATAIKLEPWNHAHVATRAGVLYLAGRYDESVAECQRALGLRPGYPGANNWLYRVLLQQGRYEDGIRAYVASEAAYVGFSPESEEQHAVRALEAYRENGLPGAAQHFLRELGGPQASLRRYDRALWRLLSADPNGAIEELKQAAGYRQYWLMFLKVDPLFKGIRANPAFVEVLADLGL